MTVRELISALKNFPPDAPILVNAPREDELMEIDRLIIPTAKYIELRIFPPDAYCAYCGGAPDGSDDTCHCPKCRPAER